MDIGSGLASFGQSIAGAMDQYHKEHQKYDQQYQLAEALSRLAISPQGQITTIDPENPNKELTPIIDKKALQQFQTTNHEQMVKNAGAMEALNRMGINLTQHAAIAGLSQRLSETGLSGQYKKAQIEHLQKENAPFTPSGVNVPVPGLGNVPMVMTSKGQAQIAPGVSRKDSHIAAAESLNAITQTLNPNLLPSHFTDVNTWANTPGQQGFKTLAVDAKGNPVPPDQWKVDRSKILGGGQQTNPAIANWIKLPEATVNSLADLQKKAVPSGLLNTDEEPPPTTQPAAQPPPVAQTVKPPAGKDFVRDKVTGQTGFYPAGKADPQRYDVIQSGGE